MAELKLQHLDKIYDNNVQAVIKHELGDQYYIYEGLQQLKKAEGVQALMPLQIQFE